MAVKCAAAHPPSYIIGKFIYNTHARAEWERVARWQKKHEMLSRTARHQSIISDEKQKKCHLYRESACEKRKKWRRRAGQMFILLSIGCAKSASADARPETSFRGRMNTIMHAPWEIVNKRVCVHQHGSKDANPFENILEAMIFTSMWVEGGG